MFFQDTFHQNDLAVKKAADVTDKPIAVYSQSISGASAIYT
jgi:hypothetical protein